MSTQMVTDWETAARRLLASLHHDLSNTGMERPFFDSWRLKLCMAGERAGKSVQGGVYGAVKHLEHLGRGNDGEYLVWILGREYINTKVEFDTIAEQYVKTGLLNPKGILTRDEGRDFCSFKIKFYDERKQARGPSLTVETVSVGDPTKIQRVAPNGIIGCEVGLWQEMAFLRTIGRLAQTNGWLWASGSFEGAAGWLVDIWRRWGGDNSEDARSYSIPSWTNRNVFADGEADAKITLFKHLYPDFLFKQRFGGVPASPKGLVYDDFVVEKHVSGLAEYKPEEPVYLFIDPGYNSAYAVLVAQVRDNTVYVVDELYETGKTAQDIINLASRQRWWQKGKYGEPVNIRYAVIDVAGTQHGAERSHEEVWRATGLRMLYRKVRIEDGIDRVRSLLRSDGRYGIPTILFNPRCRGVIAEMGGGPSPLTGRAPWSYKLARDGSIVSDAPDDNNNDSCKALAYGLVEMFGYVDAGVSVVTTPVLWTESRGPQWTQWGADDVAARETAQVLKSPGAKYLCAGKEPHDDFRSAIECKGH